MTKIKFLGQIPLPHHKCVYSFTNKPRANSENDMCVWHNTRRSPVATWPYWRSNSFQTYSPGLASNFYRKHRNFLEKKVLGERPSFLSFLSMLYNEILQLNISNLLLQLKCIHTGLNHAYQPGKSKLIRASWFCTYSPGLPSDHTLQENSLFVNMTERILSLSVNNTLTSIKF